MAEAYAAFVSPQRAEASAYLPSLLAMLLGNILLLSSALVLDGLLVLLVAHLALDGSSKILTAWRKAVSTRVPATINGFMDFGCAVLLWYLSRLIGAERAIGLITGAYIAAAGWRMLMAPVAAIPNVTAGVITTHPDGRLRLPPNEAFARLRAQNESGSQTVRATDLRWMLILCIVFLAIHAGRMPTSDSVLGFISPFVATGGDLLMTLVFAMLLMCFRYGFYGGD